MKTTSDLVSAVQSCLGSTPNKEGQCPNGSNGPIADWDVSKVVSLESLFEDKRNFDQDLSKWDTGSVTNMKKTFALAESFNADISKWDVSKVKTMNSMFAGAKRFNQDLSKWQVSSVTDMNNMFDGATAFNKILCSTVWISTKQKLTTSQPAGFGDVFKSSQGSICGAKSMHASHALQAQIDVLMVAMTYMSLAHRHARH